MDDPSEPRWDCLPDDPENFFELSDGDDVRALKRAYNRLLRRFKPEKYPAEFQRIREAYEQLSERMRYESHDTDTNVPLRDLEEWRSQASTFSPDGNQAVDRQHQDLTTRLDPPEQHWTRKKSPHDLQSELLLQERRSPREYIALAVLADVIPPTELADPFESSFPYWLIEGLRNHADDPALGELLREYLSGELPSEQRTQILTLAAEVLSPGRFYRLTERVWDRLLKQVPFEQFKQTLARCQRSQGLTTNERLIFYVQLLRAAVWKADKAWIEEVRSELEDSFFQLPSWTQNEIETLDALIAYSQHRERFAKLSELAAKIDRAIVTYYSAAEAEGDWAVLDCQYAIAERGLFLATDFPVEDDLDDIRDNLMFVWQWIVREVNDRLGLEGLDLHPEHLSEPVRQLMARMLKRSSKTKRYSSGNMMVFAGVGTLLVSLVAMVSLLVRSVIRFATVGIVSGLADLGLALLIILLGSIVGVVLAIVGVKRVALLYGDVRLELLNLFRIQPLTVREMATLIQSTEDQTVEDQSISHTNVVASGMLNDLAANFFSAALRTLAMQANPGFDR